MILRSAFLGYQLLLLYCIFASAVGIIVDAADYGVANGYLEGPGRSDFGSSYIKNDAILVKGSPKSGEKPGSISNFENVFGGSHKLKTGLGKKVITVSTLKHSKSDSPKSDLSFTQENWHANSGSSASNVTPKNRLKGSLDEDRDTVFVVKGFPNSKTDANAWRGLSYTGIISDPNIQHLKKELSNLGTIAGDNRWQLNQYSSHLGKQVWRPNLDHDSWRIRQHKSMKQLPFSIVKSADQSLIQEGETPFLSPSGQETWITKQSASNFRKTPLTSFNYETAYHQSQNRENLKSNPESSDQAIWSTKGSPSTSGQNIKIEANGLVNTGTTSSSKGTSSFKQQVIYFVQNGFGGKSSSSWKDVKNREKFYKKKIPYEDVYGYYSSPLESSSVSNSELHLQQSRSKIPSYYNMGLNSGQNEMRSLKKTVKGIKDSLQSTLQQATFSTQNVLNKVNESFSEMQIPSPSIKTSFLNIIGSGKQASEAFSNQATSEKSSAGHYQVPSSQNALHPEESDRGKWYSPQGAPIPLVTSNWNGKTVYPWKNGQNIRHTAYQISDAKAAIKNGANYLSQDPTDLGFGTSYAHPSSDTGISSTRQKTWQSQQKMIYPSGTRVTPNQKVWWSTSYISEPTLNQHPSNALSYQKLQYIKKASEYASNPAASYHQGSWHAISNSETTISQSVPSALTGQKTWQSQQKIAYPSSTGILNNQKVWWSVSSDPEPFVSQAPSSALSYQKSQYMKRARNHVSDAAVSYNQGTWHSPNSELAMSPKVQNALRRQKMWHSQQKMAYPSSTGISPNQKVLLSASSDSEPVLSQQLPNALSYQKSQNIKKARDYVSNAAASYNQGSWHAISNSEGTISQIIPNALIRKKIWYSQQKTAYPSSKGVSPNQEVSWSTSSDSEPALSQDSSIALSYQKLQNIKKTRDYVSNAAASYNQGSWHTIPNSEAAISQSVPNALTGQKTWHSQQKIVYPSSTGISPNKKVWWSASSDSEPALSQDPSNALLDQKLQHIKKARDHVSNAAASYNQGRWYTPSNSEAAVGQSVPKALTHQKTWQLQENVAHPSDEGISSNQEVWWHTSPNPRPALGDSFLTILSPQKIRHSQKGINVYDTGLSYNEEGWRTWTTEHDRHSSKHDSSNSNTNALRPNLDYNPSSLEEGIEQGSLSSLADAEKSSSQNAWIGGQSTSKIPAAPLENSDFGEGHYQNENKEMLKSNHESSSLKTLDQAIWSLRGSSNNKSEADEFMSGATLSSRETSLSDRPFNNVLQNNHDEKVSSSWIDAKNRDKYYLKQAASFNYRLMPVKSSPAGADTTEKSNSGLLPGYNMGFSSVQNKIKSWKDSIKEAKDSVKSVLQKATTSLQDTRHEIKEYYSKIKTPSSTNVSSTQQASSHQGDSSSGSSSESSSVRDYVAISGEDTANPVESGQENWNSRQDSPKSLVTSSSNKIEQNSASVAYQSSESKPEISNDMIRLIQDSSNSGFGTDYAIRKAPTYYSIMQILRNPKKSEKNTASSNSGDALSQNAPNGLKYQKTWQLQYNVANPSYTGSSNQESWWNTAPISRPTLIQSVSNDKLHKKILFSEKGKVYASNTGLSFNQGKWYASSNSGPSLSQSALNILQQQKVWNPQKGGKLVPNVWVSYKQRRYAPSKPGAVIKNQDASNHLTIQKVYLQQKANHPFNSKLSPNQGFWRYTSSKSGPGLNQNVPNILSQQEKWHQQKDRKHVYNRLVSSNQGEWLASPNAISQTAPNVLTDKKTWYVQQKLTHPSNTWIFPEQESWSYVISNSEPALIKNFPNPVSNQKPRDLQKDTTHLFNTGMSYNHGRWHASSNLKAAESQKISNALAQHKIWYSQRNIVYVPDTTLSSDEVWYTSSNPKAAAIQSVLRRWRLQKNPVYGFDTGISYNHGGWHVSSNLQAAESQRASNAIAQHSIWRSQQKNIAYVPNTALSSDGELWYTSSNPKSAASQSVLNDVTNQRIWRLQKNPAHASNTDIFFYSGSSSSGLISPYQYGMYVYKVYSKKMKSPKLYGMYGNHNTIEKATFSLVSGMNMYQKRSDVSHHTLGFGVTDLRENLRAMLLRNRKLKKNHSHAKGTSKDILKLLGMKINRIKEITHELPKQYKRSTSKTATERYIPLKLEIPGDNNVYQPGRRNIPVFFELNNHVHKRSHRRDFSFLRAPQLEKLRL